MQLQVPPGSPQWADGGEQRLLISMLFATLTVGALLALARIPPIPAFAPLIELIVRVVRQDPDDAQLAVGPESLPDEMQREDDRDLESIPDRRGDKSTVEPLAGDSMKPLVDIAAARDAAIEAYLDRLENPPSVNPVMAAKRRDLAGRYQPPSHPGRRPIWENVEKDQLGRTVLRSGDCYKVIEDPNVGSQYAFRTFGQHMVICTWQKRLPKNLPWVAEFRERYHYLKYPDGYVPDDDSAE